MILKKIEHLINRSPFYNLIRFNFFTDALIEWKTGRTKKAIDFYNSFLEKNTPNRIVFDIGANKGNKVKAFLKMGFKVIAVEPEKKALSTLHWRFGKNKNVVIVPKGVSDIEGELTIHIAEGRSGLNTLNEKWVNTLQSEKNNRWKTEHSFKKSYQVKITTPEQLFADHGLPYFMKIDVEGYENKVIRGIKSLPSYISFETNLPEFRDETLECIQTLTDLYPKIEFNYSFEDRLVSRDWVTGEAIRQLILRPDIRYMEIIGKSNHSSL